MANYDDRRSNDDANANDDDRRSNDDSPRGLIMTLAANKKGRESESNPAVILSPRE